jgi:hypothetical protein
VPALHSGCNFLCLNSVFRSKSTLDSECLRETRPPPVMATLRAAIYQMQLESSIIHNSFPNKTRGHVRRFIACQSAKSPPAPARAAAVMRASFVAAATGC